MSKKIWKRRSFWFAVLFAVLTVFSLLFLVQGAQADIPALQPLLGWLGFALVVSFVMCIIAVWNAAEPQPTAASQRLTSCVFLLSAAGSVLIFCACFAKLPA